MQIELPAHGWEPAPHQLKAWNALARGVRTVVLAWHRRAGKDEIALHSTAIKAMERVGNYWHMLPMQEQARKALWEAVNPRTGRVRWKDAFPDEIIKHVDNQGMKITFVNGSTWQLLGSDNYNSLVGTTPVGMVFSEAALADPAAFAFFRPILLENNGWSLHISSTRGKNHFHRQYLSALADPEAFAECLSAHDTGMFTPIQLAAERRAYIDLYGAALGNSFFEQEYLSSWEAAVIGAVFGQELRDLRAEGRALPLRYDPRFPVDTSWDLGVGDTNVILFWQTVGNIERLFDWYAATDTGIEHYAEILARKRYHYRHHAAPHDIAVREWGANGVTRMATAKKLNLDLDRMPNIAKHDQIGCASRLLKRMEINVSDRPVDDPMDDCAFILEAFEQYHFHFDKEKRIMSKNPVHDWSSHYNDALMQRGIYLADKPGSQRPLDAGTPQIETFDHRRLRQLMRGRRTGAWG